MHRYELVQILIICIITATAIFTYGMLRCHFLDNHDPLTNRLLPGVDGWLITHVVFYGVLAYLYPSWPALLFIATLGVLWELTEMYFAFNPPNMGPCKFDGLTEDKSAWWYARVSDVVANTIGMIIGVLVHNSAAVLF